MAVSPLAALHRKLFDETDGVKFSKLKDRLLKKHAGDDRLAVLDILDGFGQRSVITFAKFETNPALGAEVFQFKPPAGADVLKP